MQLQFFTGMCKITDISFTKAQEMPTGNTSINLENVIDVISGNSSDTLYL